MAFIEYEPHAAFDLATLSVRVLAKLLRQLGHRGDFTRVRKIKLIALIELHDDDAQEGALAAVGMDPAPLRLPLNAMDTDAAWSALATIRRPS